MQTLSAHSAVQETKLIWLSMFPWKQATLCLSLPVSLSLWS